MKLIRWTCLALAMVLAMGGMALGEEAAVEAEVIEEAAPVEEVEAVLGEEAPAEAEAAPVEEDVPMEAAPDAVPPETEGEQAVAAPSGPLTALSLPGTLVLGVKEQRQLAPVPTPEDAAYGVTYASNKKKIVAVDAATGVITGKKKGTAVITATADNGVTAQVQVAVMAAPKTVTLTAPAAAGVGDRFACKVDYNAKAGGGWTLTSDNPGVLRVEADGTVTALAQGAATLTATSFNGKSASATVPVGAAATAMWLNETGATLGLGGTLKLTVGMPAGEAAALTYTSSDGNIAAVDPVTGVVTGVNLGNATITARTTSGLEDHCAVTVLPAPQKLAVASANVALGVGQSAQLVATPVPEGSACTLSYKSSKPKAVAVSEDGVVTGLKKGSAVITITTQNKKKAKVKVRVLAEPKTVSLSLGRANLGVGESTKANVILTKNTASNLTFSVDDPAIASVSADGTVTALAEGSCVISVQTANGLTAGAALTVGTPKLPEGAPEVDGLFEITFMNIGRNDGILMHCGGEWAFIDSGLHQHGTQAVNHMRSLGVDKLRYYIGSHAHIDHVGGAGVILANVPTQEVIVPHIGVANAIKRYAYGGAEKQAAEAVSYRVVTRGEKFYLGGAEFLVLGPVRVRNANPAKSEENHNSLIVRVTYGINTFLLTGDATVEEIAEVENAEPGCLRAQVLKNPHHNVRSNGTPQKVLPQIVVFSTDAKKLPASSYVKEFTSMGCAAYITSSNRNGDVKITSDGVNLTVIPQYQ